MHRTINRIIFFIAIFSALSTSCKKTDDPEPLQPESPIEANKKTAVAVVHASAVGLGELLRSIPDSASRILTIRVYIDSIRFYEDNSGYFYVYNFQCTNLAHATQKDLIGKDLHDYQDSRGKYVIRELSAIAQLGGGFVEYYWIKPGEVGEKLKIGYVEPIPGTNYFIGTGVYITY
jgi:signal transduction histidine kinase